MPRTMKDSYVNTLAVLPVTGTASDNTSEPTTIVKSAHRDLVVRVRNNTFGSWVLISFDVGALASYPNLNSTWKIPAGGVDSFVVARGQGLYAATPSGINGEISIHYFDSLPVDIE